MARQALLVMDLQNFIIGMAGAESEAVLENTAQVLSKARAAKIPVIHVMIDIKDFPANSNKSFSAYASHFAALLNDEEKMAFHSKVAPIQGGKSNANL